MIEILLALCTGAFLFILLELRIRENDKKESEEFFNLTKEQDIGRNK